MVAGKNLKTRKQNKAAIRLQARWRGHRDSSYYKKLIRAAVITQSRWKGRLARKELRKLKMAAKEAKEAKDNLKKQLEELSKRLESEKRLKVELEEAKDQEIVKVQNSLKAMQREVNEANSVLVKERESAQKAIQAKEEEILELKNSLKAMQSNVDETNSLLAKERESAEKAIKEAKDQEILKLQNSLQEIQNKLDEANALLIKERESVVRTIQETKAAKDQEVINLQNSLQEMQNNFDMTNALLVQERESVERKIQEAKEAKDQEIMKLQNSLQAMQSKIDETNALLVKERESARKAIEEASSVVKEIPVRVEDTDRIASLTTEVKNLKALSEWERQRADESEKKCNEAVESSEYKRMKLEETERRVLQLQESLDRLEDKLADLESHNQALNQQGSPMPHNKKLQEGYSRSFKDRQSSAAHSRNSSDLDDSVKRPVDDQKQEYHDLLTRCIAQRLGFSKGRPVAACIIYKCLRKWRSFEAEKTSIFDRIIQAIGRTIETQDNSDVLAYWLSNASTLLLLIQHTLKASSTSGDHPHHRRPRSGKRTQSFRGSPHGLNISISDIGETTPSGSESSRQLEPKYPAMLFKQQLTAYVEKTFGLIRDNLKREISPLLGLCIQAPRISKANLSKGTARALANAASHEILLAQWQGIVTKIGCLLNILKANYVPSFLIRQVFTQIFSFVNVQLFNSLLLRRECCSYSNGEYVRSGLSILERWCLKATEEYAGSAWDELKHIRQAIAFLVTHQKPKKTLHEISGELCPMLTIQQLYRISTMYWDDKHGTHNLSPEVISNMRILMTQESTNAVTSNNSFLLDDDSSIPFSTDDLTRSMDQIGISDIDPPPLLRDSSGFSFLQRPS